MISANMDKGAEEFQLEAAISKIYGSVRLIIYNPYLFQLFYRKLLGM